MTPRAFNVFCAAFPGATHVVQWGGADVWKVGGKVFAFAYAEGEALAITFKAGEFAYDILRDAPGMRPAPYLASRGLKWIQADAPGVEAAELREYVRRSYGLVVAGLPKAKQAAIGSAPAAVTSPAPDATRSGAPVRVRRRVERRPPRGSPR